MKVTKIIREYIEEQVMQKYRENPELKALWAEAEAQREAWNRDVDQLTKECNEKLEALYAKHHDVNRYPKAPYFHTSHYYNQYLPAEGRAHDLDKELRAKCDQAIKNIIFRLEMGGKKDEIQDMLDEVEF